ncbi:hypothetical protein RYX36_017929 [Vicia faba]
MHKPILSGGVKHSRNKSSLKSANDTMLSRRFPSLPSKSSEMASKILQQLHNLVSSKEKSSVLRLPSVKDKSPPTKFSNMSKVENDLKPVSLTHELIPAVEPSYIY